MLHLMKKTMRSLILHFSIILLFIGCSSNEEQRETEEFKIRANSEIIIPSQNSVFFVVVERNHVLDAPNGVALGVVAIRAVGRHACGADGDARALLPKVDQVDAQRGVRVKTIEGAALHGPDRRALDGKLEVKPVKMLLESARFVALLLNRMKSPGFLADFWSTTRARISPLTES